MEILAFGVQADEKPLIERAFRDHEDVRCLDVFLNEDTAPIAAGHEIVSTSVNADLGAAVLEILAAGGTGWWPSAPPASTTSTWTPPTGSA